MENSRKRRIPRHVDGRIMVGPMYIKNFIIFLVTVLIPTAIFFFTHATPGNMLLSCIIIVLFGMLFSEINRNETLFSVFLDFLRYRIEGDKHFERSCLSEPAHKRYIRNKIKRTEKE